MYVQYSLTFWDCTRTETANMCCHFLLMPSRQRWLIKALFSAMSRYTIRITPNIGGCQFVNIITWDETYLPFRLGISLTPWTQNWFFWLHPLLLSLGLDMRPTDTHFWFLCCLQISNLGPLVLPAISGSGIFLFNFYHFDQGKKQSKEIWLPSQLTWANTKTERKEIFREKTETQVLLTQNSEMDRSRPPLQQPLKFHKSLP